MKNTIKIFSNYLFYFIVVIACISFTNYECKNDKNTIVPDKDTLKQDTTPILKKDPVYLFVGTYSGNNSKGIYLYKMDTVSGQLTFINSFQTENPSFLCVHPNRKWIYVVGETSNGSVSALAFDTTKKSLSFLNKVSAKGDAPCYISVDKSGKFVMVANYSTGNVSLFPIKADGSLEQATSVINHTGKSIDANRQNEPHAHMIAQVAQSPLVYAADLGIDKIMAYNLDISNKKLISTTLNTKVTPGSGPRHFVGHATLPYLYLLNELNGKIDAYSINSTSGALSLIQNISNMQDGDKRYPGSAEILITPNGKILYATNRGDVNTIGMYTIDQANGNLSFLGFEASQGNGPRSFAISPSGKFLLIANQNSGSLVLFDIQQDGKLKPKSIKIDVPNAVCIKFW